MKLEKSKRFSPNTGPVVTIVLDGVGMSPREDGDAIKTARTPMLDGLFRDYPWVKLLAHGLAVGMPSNDDMGNSEVGHNALGAGRVFDQGAKLVNRALADGSLVHGEAWKGLTTHCLEANTPMHFIGLLSDGNVHSHIAHLEAMLNEAARIGIRRVFVHPL